MQDTPLSRLDNSILSFVVFKENGEALAVFWQRVSVIRTFAHKRGLPPISFVEYTFHSQPQSHYRRQQMRTHILRRLMMTLLTLSFIVSGAVAFADQFEDSIAAYDRGDYATAVRLLRPLAEQGNAQAQNGLGAMYYNGKGVAQDFKEAVKWYRLAAVQGYASAQLNLGAMYYEGQGVVENFIRAYMWLSIAAAKGNANAEKLRDVVSKYIIDHQIVEAQAMARKCETSSYKQCD